MAERPGQYGNWSGNIWRTLNGVLKVNGEDKKLSRKVTTEKILEISGENTTLC
jgi:hypothetical protein